MGKFFFVSLWVLVGLAVALFFPIYLETDAHYDMNRRKLAFAVYAYKILPIFGGYLATYTGGLAVHISKKKAILIPYSKVNNERKKFSFFKTFRLKSFILTTESGAEYLFLTAIAQIALRTLFFITGGEKKGVKNNLWLTDGDVLRISLNSVFYFNLFILVKSFLKFCKEKIKELCRKKIKKSTR